MLASKSKSKSKENIMKTVSVSFKNRPTQTVTATFDVYAASELSREERNALVAQYRITSCCSLNCEDWQDEDTARIEKEAARMAGLDGQRAFLVRTSLK